LASPRSVLITGCSSGIGYCAAHGLQQRGYQVFASARKPADVARLKSEGLNCLQLDVRDSESIHNAVGELFEATGGTLYGLFNNAGYGQPGAVEDLSREVLRDQLETNVLGLHELTCKVLPAMRARGEGRIIQNSSILGFTSMRFRGAYQVSKYALEGLTDTLRLELADTEIYASLIEPGPIESDFRKNARAAFAAHIDIEASPFKDVYATVQQRLNSENENTRFTLPATAVLDKVIHALESSRPKPRYYVTVPTHAFGFLKRFLSTRMMDRILLVASKSESR
jgi:NAD(P)-dependent dehydrogenase (short-subunit alcohol dehydrogenase family)